MAYKTLKQNIIGGYYYTILSRTQLINYIMRLITNSTNIIGIATNNFKLITKSNRGGV